MSKDYTAITGNNNGLPHPDSRAIDATGPTATDGTELLKEVMNDVWLRRQAFMDFYNQTPDGLDDLAGVDGSGFPLSQPLVAKYMNYAPPGLVVSWTSQLDPVAAGALAGCDIRIILLQGQGVDRTVDDYKLLDLMCYVGDGDNPTADSYYRATDAGGTIRNITGQYLILPDARGYFWRGLDPSGTIDPDGASRLVGSMQDDSFQGHWHDALYDNLGNQYGLDPNVGNGADTGIDNDGVLARTGDAIEDATSGLPRTSSETRAKNIATRYGIYY